MHPVLRKISNFTRLAVEEQDALSAVLSRTSTVNARTDLARQDDEPHTSFFLIEGFAVRHKATAEGQRQILNFVLPGDGYDPGTSLLERLDHSVTTMVPSVVAHANEAELDQLLDRYPKIKDAFRWAALVEEAISREWILNVGQRHAVGRLCHLVCEVHRRMEAIGQVEGDSFVLPLTQVDLADTLALSAVHVNRTLQDLRKQKLLSFGAKRVTILDYERLRTVAGFEDTYLHLRARPR